MPLIGLSFESGFGVQCLYAHLGVFQDTGQKHSAVRAHAHFHLAAVLCHRHFGLRAFQAGPLWCLVIGFQCGGRQCQAVQRDLPVIALG